jgi:sentrin-specific protease 8
MSTKEEIILNYNDSLIYESDLEILNDGQWLNDRLIAFVYEYLEREIYLDQPAVSFLNPSTVQFLKLCSSMDEARMCFLDPLDMNKKKYCFMPLNNNIYAEMTGGTHWSLMFVDRSTSIMYHFDSIGSNNDQAIKFFQKYKSYFGLEKYLTYESFPKQSNSSDCGVYVLGKNILINKIEFMHEILLKNFIFLKLQQSFWQII